MQHAYVIGTDEAGYGPNLGPLVISATAWEVPWGVRGEDLYRLLAPYVAPSLGGTRHCKSLAVAIGDSKTLYQRGAGLGHLERGVLGSLALLEKRPGTWREVWAALAPEAAREWPSVPWYAEYDGLVPVDCDLAETLSAAMALSQGCARAGVRLLAIRSRAVFPEEFNRVVARHGSKGRALSHATLELVAAMLAALPEGPVVVVCDKHGGRNRYQPLLAEHFPESLVTIHGESRQQSVYRFGPQQRRVEIRFETKGESHLPTALASMTSKYLRELAMRALNDFWRQRVPGLRATGGYPEDARRFKSEIAAVQARLGIDDRVLWRSR